LKEPTAEEAYMEIKKSSSICLFEEIPQTPLIPEKEAEGVISQKEAQIGLIRDKLEPSSFSENKLEPSSAGVSGISGISSKEDTGKEIVVCEENIQALLKATQGSSGYWTASEVAGAYHDAGGRNFWSLIQVLSSEGWLKTNPQIWLEEHPRLKGMYRLRRR